MRHNIDLTADQLRLLSFGSITYNHDEALKVMLPKLSILPCWAKRGYWSQSTNAPKNVLASEAIVEVVDATE